MIEAISNRVRAILGRRPEAPEDGARMHIPTVAMLFHASSYADPRGRLFSSGGMLFRGVPAGSAAISNRLFDVGVVQALVDKQLLVPTQRSAKTAEGFALVIEHSRVPFVSYPYEWPSEMLRAGALHTLALLNELSGRGLTLKDAHGWNILFEGCRPVFVDFGSIIEMSEGGAWRAEQEFREYFLYPLELMAVGPSRIARALLHDFEKGIRLEDCQSLTAMVNQPRPELGHSMPIEWYQERISALDLKPPASAWAAYYDGEFPPLAPDESWNEKHRAVHRLLQQHRPATVLDIGANRGWYSLLAATEGARVVAFDNDEVCINQLFLDARQRGLDVQPLVMSCLNPSPRYGLANGLMEAAVERLRCDLVLGLALVHHMVFKMYLNFDQIAAGLAAFATKTLVVEFPPSDDFHVKQWMTDQYAWYTEENFRSALLRYFTKINSVASHPSPRILLVCER